MMKYIYKNGRKIKVASSVANRYIANGWKVDDRTTVMPTNVQPKNEEPDVVYNPEVIDAMSAGELKKFAEQNKIDISSASNKREAKAIIKEFFN